jgi:uncharacterized protein YndB with AHSA1/START domain
VSNLPHTVKRSVVLEAAPEEVWEAVTEEKLLVDAVAGGTRLTVIESRLDPGAPALVAAAWSAPLSRARLLLSSLVLA